MKERKQYVIVGRNARKSTIPTEQMIIPSLTINECYVLLNSRMKNENLGSVQEVAYVKKLEGFSVVMLIT